MLARTAGCVRHSCTVSPRFRCHRAGGTRPIFTPEEQCGCDSICKVQAILSAGAFTIEHPENAGDSLLVARAGLHGALLAYRATVAAEPKRASQFFDDLVALEDQGKLDDYLASRMKTCK